jgi:hypothetical protein
MPQIGASSVDGIVDTRWELRLKTSGWRHRSIATTNGTFCAVRVTPEVPSSPIRGSMTKTSAALRISWRRAHRLAVTPSGAAPVSLPGDWPVRDRRQPGSAKTSNDF